MAKKFYSEVKVVPATKNGLYSEVKLGKPTVAKPAKKAATKPATKPTTTKPAAKKASSAYNPPAYDEKKYSKGIDTSYYTNAAEKFRQQANANRATQIGDAQRQQQSNLRNAYVTRLQNQKAMNQNLATAGIRGGATETAGLRLASQYGNAVAAANSDYANSVNAINQNIDQSINDYTADMASRAEEYRQNQMNARWQAAREDYANRFNAQREDAANKLKMKREDEVNRYERKQAEKQRQTEYWSNYYINKYSGLKKKDLKKAEKEIRAKLKKAKTPNAKIRYQQALAGIGARRGVIATSK